MLAAKDETMQGDKTRTIWVTNTLHASICFPNDIGKHAPHDLPMFDRLLLLPLCQRVHHVLEDVLLAFVFWDIVANGRDVSFVLAEAG